MARFLINDKVYYYFVSFYLTQIYKKTLEISTKIPWIKLIRKSVECGV